MRGTPRPVGTQAERGLGSAMAGDWPAPGWRRGGPGLGVEDAQGPGGAVEQRAELAVELLVELQASDHHYCFGGGRSGRKRERGGIGQDAEGGCLKVEQDDGDDPPGMSSGVTGQVGGEVREAGQAEGKDVFGGEGNAAGRGQEAGKGCLGIEVEAFEVVEVVGQHEALAVGVGGVEAKDGAQAAGEAGAEGQRLQPVQLRPEGLAEQLRRRGRAAELRCVLTGALQGGSRVEVGLVGAAGAAHHAVAAPGVAAHRALHLEKP